MAEAFSYLQWRSCTVKHRYSSARRAALDAVVLRLRGRNVHVYRCPWAEAVRLHWHVGHPPGRRGSLVA